jgi:DNA-directed RNA polymerase subunit H (RpoH/RPB5)
MLENLGILLQNQQFQKIIIFPDDRYPIEKLSQAIQASTSSAKPKKDLFVSGTAPLFTAQQIKKRKLYEQFFPSYVIQRECVVGHARSPQGDLLVVIFCGLEQMEGGKLGKKILEQIVDHAENIRPKISQICFLHAGEITPHARDYIRVGHVQMKFQLFHVDMIRQNFLEYHLMPKLHILSEPEKKELLDMKNPNVRVSIDQLPHLWQTDKIARYFNATKDTNTILYSTYETFHGKRYRYRLVTEEAKEKKISKQTKKKEK